MGLKGRLASFAKNIVKKIGETIARKIETERATSTTSATTPPPTTPAATPTPTPPDTSAEVEGLRREFASRAEATETRAPPRESIGRKILGFIGKHAIGTWWIRVSIIVGVAIFVYWLFDKLGLVTGFNAFFTFGIAMLFFLAEFVARSEKIRKFLGNFAIIFIGIIGFIALAMIPISLSPIITTIGMVVYIFFILFAAGIPKATRIIAIGLNLTIILLLVVASVHVSIFRSNSPLYVAIENQQEEWRRMYDGITSVFSEAGRVARSRIHYAMGDYEEGIEAQSERPLGVFLEDIGITSKVVTEDGIIDVYARLRAESFKTEKPLNISVSCHIEDDKKMKGKIRPHDKFIVEEYESQDLDCIMDVAKLQLLVGSHQIAMETSFNFNTGAYLKSYFMTQERVRSYRRQNIDPLDAFQITDRNPIGVYSAGPLKIGMGAGQQA